MTREEYYKAINSILDDAIAKLSETLDAESEAIKELEEPEMEEIECDGNCEKCEHYHATEGLEFENMLTLIKDDPDLTFTCPQTFEDGEYIFLDTVTYDTPTLVKVGLCDQHSVYTPTTEEMFDFVWELVD